MVRVTFLGTADQIPSVKRNHTGIFLTQMDENILIDCGEGMQRQFRIAGLNPCKITKILITHVHGDHVLGLSGILQTLSVSGYNKKLSVYGPVGIKEFMRKLLDAFPFRCEYDIKVEEAKGKFFDNGDFYLEAEEMTHGCACNSYSFVKVGKRRIDKNKLKKLKIKAGPHLQKLKDGKNISYEGKKYLAKDLTYVEDDLKVSVVLDTTVNEKIVPFVKNASLLISESTFGSELKEKAEEHNHMTVIDAAKIAKKAKVKKLVLTHISQRYEAKLKDILSQAKAVFPESVLVKDFDKIEI